MSITLDERPIFVIGSERSGTTLLLAILACHPRIAVPEVTWFYPRFRNYLHTYGDLSDIDNFNTLAHEMAYGLRIPFWNMRGVNPANWGNEIARRAAEIEPSFAGVFAAMFERYAEQENKPRWGEKTPGNVFYVERILEDFPNAQFVYIYRDCRDASAEFLDSQFGPTNAYTAAKMWNDGQAAVKPIRERLGDDQWFDVKYEEFVVDPVNHLKRMCDFLGEDYTDGLMEFHTTPTAQRRGKTKDNWALAHPITDRHVGIYKHMLSIDEQRIMSWVAGDLMRELAYGDIAEPLELTPEQIDLVVEMDGRARAVTLDAPHGWITYESYGDWLIDQRQARKRAGVWSDADAPAPPPYPVGTPDEEYYSGMRAMRQWKEYFCIKRDYTGAKSVLK
ncbi:MAG: sulfotransferase [Proteobacteria bacterium]|nr:sulfotransferase [Pseudomonadota bacterium]